MLVYINNFFRMISSEETLKQLQRSLQEQFSATDPLWDSTARIFDSYHDEEQETNNNDSNHMSLKEPMISSDIVSPQINEQAFVNRQTIHSSQMVRSDKLMRKPKQQSGDSAPVRSINSSTVVTEAKQLNSSYNTSGFSVNKSQKKGFKLKKQNAQIAVHIKRKLNYHDSLIDRMASTFMMTNRLSANSPQHNYEQSGSSKKMDPMRITNFEMASSAGRQTSHQAPFRKQHAGLIRRGDNIASALERPREMLIALKNVKRDGTTPGQQRMPMQTDFKCRYKELTWVKGGLNRATPSTQMQNNTRKGRSKLHMNATSRQPPAIEQTRAKTFEPIRPDVYIQNANDGEQQQQQLNQQYFSHRAPSNQPINTTRRKHQHVQNVYSLPTIPKNKNGQQSQDYLAQPNDSVFSGMRTLKFHNETHASSKDIATSRLETFKSEYRNIPTKSSIKKDSQVKLQNRHTVSKVSEIQQESTRLDQHQSSQNTLDNRGKRSYETFEFPVGGSRTGASIFFAADHAEKMENEEFERLFGARQGRKFRTGQSVEVNQNSRTMSEQLNYLDPSILKQLRQQYTTKQAGKFEDISQNPYNLTPSKILAVGSEVSLEQPVMVMTPVPEQMQDPILVEESEGDESSCGPEKIQQQQIDAYATFRQLGGSFFRQPDRQILTTDTEGVMYYETKYPGPVQVDTVADVMKIVQKGILSNEPKPKKIVRPPTPEPEIERLLHLEVSTVHELIDLFDENERDLFYQELLEFQSKEEPTTYLLARIDELSQYQNDRYCVQLSQVFKMLLKKRVDLVHSRERLRKFKPDEMDKHIESYMRKMYDEYVALVLSQLTAKKVQTLQSQGLSLENATQTAKQIMSMTKMEETKVSHKKKLSWSHDRQIIEYIKYLLGKTANNEFQLRKEDFKQTHELHTKSLALPFDEYAAKEDNSMKKVANDILERVEMNIVIQEHAMPIAALKYADDPKFKYFMKIREQMSLALPLIAKVVNKQFSLHNYKLGYEHCVALGSTCNYNYHFMSKLVLNNNGLTDESLAEFFKGLQHMRTISLIDLRRNQVGQQSVRLMQDFMSRRQPLHLQILRIVDCKIDHSTTGLLIDLLNEHAQLRTFALVNASFNSVNEKKLAGYLKNSAGLRELDLSWNQMSQHAYIDILHVIVENNYLLMLNLSHNQLIIDPKTFTTEEGKLIKQEKMARFKNQASNERKANDVLRKSNQAFVSAKSLRQGSVNSGNSKRNQQSRQFANIIIDSISTSHKQQQSGRTPKQEINTNLLELPRLDSDSIKSSHSQSAHSYADVFNQKKAQLLMQAEKYVGKSSQLNQVVTLLLTKVLKENRRLQHLNLTSTNLPSQVIIHLCNRMRRSRSICSIHFTDNPGLEEQGLESSIFKLLKCKPRDEPKNKIDISKQIDFALDSNMINRLHRQLQDEKGEDGTKIAANTIRFRQIMQQKRIEQKRAEFPEDISQKKMILSRYIGMKEMMPGSGQWQLLTDRNDECWHCDQWIFSLVFWDEQTIGRKARKAVHPKVLNQMVKKVNQLNPILEKSDSQISLSVYNQESMSMESESEKKDDNLITVQKLSSKQSQPVTSLFAKNTSPQNLKELKPDELKQHSERSRPPLIFGDFNNWKGKEMMRLDDFVLLLAMKYGRQNEDVHTSFDVIFDEMKKKLTAQRNFDSDCGTSNSSLDRDLGKISSPTSKCKNYEDLTSYQKRYFDKILRQRHHRILSGWKGIIEQYLEYRKPFLLDAYLLDSKKYNGRCPDLYVLPVFMPAGKHSYLVKNMQTYEYSMHNALADFRTEDPPILIKDLKRKVTQRIFRKENSVFAPWTEDTPMTLQLACESDIGNCRLSKLVKEPEELKNVLEFVHERFANLKLLFLKYACVSTYPHINSTTIEQFANDFNLLDDDLKLSALHIIYTSVYKKPQKGQTKTGLNRPEFIELLIRIAVHKYTKKQWFQSSADALHKLVDDVLLNDFQMSPSQPWQEFRARYLWTLDVNDVFHANIHSLQKLYKKNQTIHKTWMDFHEVLYLFCTETNLLPEYQAKFCFGSCKMTITDVITNEHQNTRLQFVEFLEMIGRVSVAYWEQNKEHLEEVPLAKKIEFVISQLLALQGVKLKQVYNNIESESESDDEY